MTRIVDSQEIRRGMLGRFALLIGSFLLGISAAYAAEVKNVLRLDPISEAEKVRWTNEGFNVIDLACDEPTLACITESVSAQPQTNGTVLIAASKHSELIKSFYESSADAGSISTIVLLGADPAISPPISARPDAPDFLVFAGRKDPVEQVVAARKFTDALLANGLRSTMLFAPDGLIGRNPLDRLLTDIILHFVGQSPFNEQFNSLLNAYTDWQTPPFDNKDFLGQTDFVREYEMSDQVKMLLRVHFAFEPHLINQWPLQSFRAFDLMAYKERVAPDARYVTLRNIREQVMFLDLEEYGPYEPVIIVGIDDETNLYKMAWFYRTKAKYSWLPDTPELSARLLGPFVYFRNPIPEEMQFPMLLRSAISLDGITFSEEDPLVSIKDYPEEIQQIITTDNKCIYCHQIGGIGGRYHHTEAATAEPQGGIAIPLEAYPDFVMDSFLYDQVATAEKIGMTPNPLADEVVKAFDEWYQTLPKITDPAIQ